MRHSKKRDKILEILKSAELFSAEDLCKRIKDIDRATIYRNLKKFVEEGRVREIRIKKNKSYFEINSDNHQHFICINCDKIIPIDVDEKLLLNLPVIIDKVEEIEVNIRGKCKTCN